MESKCMFCGSDLDTGMKCPKPDCQSHEPIYINRACAPNCPGNIKPRTPAEAEEMVDRFATSLRQLYEIRLDGGMSGTEFRKRFKKIKAALIAALTGGGE